MARIQRNRPTATSAQALAGTDGHRVMTAQSVAQYVNQWGLGADMTPYSGDMDALNSGPTRWVYASLAANAPANYGMCLVMGKETGFSAVQVFYSVDEREYTRYIKSGVWTSWAENWNSANCGSSRNSSGYQQLASGVILQWADVVVEDDSPVSVVFPIAFPTGCRAICGKDNDVGTRAEWSALNKSPTGFDLDRDNALSGAVTFGYLAIGY